MAAERAGFGGGAAASSTASPKNAFALATVCNLEELYGGKTLVGCLAARLWIVVADKMYGGETPGCLDSCSEILESHLTAMNDGLQCYNEGVGLGIHL